MRSTINGLPLSLLLVSGILNGSSAVPLKYAKRSAWENLWLIQSILAMLVLPWVLVWFTVPRAMEVYRVSGLSPLAAAAGFGFGWGIGGLLYIIGVVSVGMSVSFAIILSLTATLGSIFPLLALHPHEINSRQGHFLIAALLLAVIGILFCAYAGAGRIEESSASSVLQEKRYFWRGVIVCVLSGIFSPMLNFAFVFGDRVNVVARQFGASLLWAPNALWAIAFTAAFWLNAFYCLYHLGLKKSWSRFLEAPGEHFIGGSIMGLLLWASIFIYGVSAEMLGTWGTTAGWAVNMCSTIFAANVWGLMTGEWRGASRKSYVQLALGLGTTMIAIVLAAPVS
ncbi:MAG: L-rhamnose/proton symporter RhaT [Candidatus Sulfotelmatobacter sp.]